MTDRDRGREVAGMQRIGDQLECHRACGQRRRLVHQLFSGAILDPELAQIGADAIHRAFVQFHARAVAGFVN